MTPTIAATALVDVRAGAIVIVGLGVELAVAGLYLAAVRRTRRAGRRWPAQRTAAFLAGLACLAFALQSGFAAYDETFWAHLVQHAILMTAAPALIVSGAPVTLLLRVASAKQTRRLIGVLHNRRLHWMNGRSAAIHLPVHYYGVMFAYLLTPAYALAQSNSWFHEAVHAYVIGCGLMFWLPVLGRYPARWHPANATKRRMIAAGVPAGLVLAALVAAAPPSGVSEHDATLGVVALIVTSVVGTAAGLLALRQTEPRTRRAKAPATATLPGLAVSAVSRRA